MVIPHVSSEDLIYKKDSKIVLKKEEYYFDNNISKHGDDSTATTSSSKTATIEADMLISHLESLRQDQEMLRLEASQSIEMYKTKAEHFKVLAEVGSN